MKKIFEIKFLFLGEGKTRPKVSGKKLQLILGLLLAALRNIFT